MRARNIVTEKGERREKEEEGEVGGWRREWQEIWSEPASL